MHRKAISSTFCIVKVWHKYNLLLGVGEVTEENLVESVVLAMRYLLSADEETIAGIMTLMGEFATTSGESRVKGESGAGEGDVTETGGGGGAAEEGGQGHGAKGDMGDNEDIMTTTTSTTQSTRYTTKAPRTIPTTMAPPTTGSQRGVVDVFRRILLLTGTVEFSRILTVVLV